MNVTYYYIKDLNIVGKEVDYEYYLYQPGKGWTDDNDNLLMDRLMGYDESEPADSPYKIGNTSIMNLVKEIREEEANKIIEDLQISSAD